MIVSNKNMAVYLEDNILDLVRHSYALPKVVQNKQVEMLVRMVMGKNEQTDSKLDSFKHITCFRQIMTILKSPLLDLQLFCLQ